MNKHKKNYKNQKVNNRLNRNRLRYNINNRKIN